MKLPKRFSLASLMIGLTVVSVAFAWRACCLRQLHRIGNTAEVTAFLVAEGSKPEKHQNADEHTEQESERIKSMRIATPATSWHQELASWGLMPVTFDAVFLPIDVKPADADGWEDLQISHTVFEGELRPWGITNVRVSDKYISEVSRKTNFHAVR